MSLKSKLNQLENTIDDMYRRNPNDPRISIYEMEADEIAEQMSKIQEKSEAQLKAIEAKAKELRKAKVEHILHLYKSKAVDEMFETYGSEFIEDYEVIGNTVVSTARDGIVTTWEDEEDTDKKIRQLVYYRIYDHYRR